MKKALNITVMLLVLMALSFSLISCNGEAEEKVNEVLGTDVKLNGTWKSEPISYRHDGKDYSGAVELRFNDTQLQIVAPHGTSKIHRYTRSGITLTITDAYAPEDNPFKDLPFGLEFAGGGFSVDLGGLTFTEGMSNIKLKFTKTSDSAVIKEPDSPAGGDLPSNPDEPSGSVRVPTKQEFIESTPGYFVAPTEGLQIADEETIYMVSEIAEMGEELLDETGIKNELFLYNASDKNGVIYTERAIDNSLNEFGNVTINGNLTVGDDTYVFRNLVSSDWHGSDIKSGEIFVNGIPVEYSSVNYDELVTSSIDEILESYSIGYMNGTISKLVNYEPDGDKFYWTSYLDVTKDGKHIQISSGPNKFFSSVAVNGVFYDPDFVWRTQTDLVKCPESAFGEFVVPDGITRIGAQAFRDCTGLTSIMIPDSVTSIGDWAFMDCTGLTSITIPSSVTSIGDWAFYGYEGLVDIYVNQVESSLLDNAGLPSDCTIHWSDSNPEAPVLPTYDELKKSLPGYMERYEGAGVDADTQVSSLVSNVLSEVNDSMLAPNDFSEDLYWPDKNWIKPSFNGGILGWFDTDEYRLLNGKGYAMYTISGDDIKGSVLIEDTDYINPLIIVASGNVNIKNEDIIYDDTLIRFADTVELSGALYKNDINLIGTEEDTIPSSEIRFLIPEGSFFGEESIKELISWHLYAFSCIPSDNLTVSSYEEGTYSNYVARVFIDTVKDGSRVQLTYSTTNEPTRTRHWTTGSVLETVCIDGTYYDPETVVVGI